MIFIIEAMFINTKSHIHDWHEFYCCLIQEICLSHIVNNSRHVHKNIKSIGFMKSLESVNFKCDNCCYSAILSGSKFSIK